MKELEIFRAYRGILKKYITQFKVFSKHKIKISFTKSNRLLHKFKTLKILLKGQEEDTKLLNKLLMNIYLSKWSLLLWFSAVIFSLKKES